MLTRRHFYALPPAQKWLLLRRTGKKLNSRKMKYLIVLLIAYLTVTDGGYCPAHCTCKERDARCVINDSIMEIHQIFMSGVDVATITCEGANFTCAVLPKLESHGKHLFVSSNCSRSTLSCINHIFDKPVVKALTLTHIDEALQPEDVANLTDVRRINLTLNGTDIMVPIATINNWISLFWVEMHKGHLNLPPNNFNHNSLTELNLYGNKISGWSVGAFSRLRNLTLLGMFGADVERDTINPGTFKGLNKLQKLYLKYMSIKNIEPGTFVDTPNLKLLNLDQNPFESLPNGFLTGLKSLESLHITCLPRTDQEDLHLGCHAFANQHQLKEIELGLCKLNYLPDTLFSNSNNISSIDIGDNIIKTISSKIFSNLTSLTDLKLNNNSIQGLPDDIFANLSNLQHLTLVNNGIIKLQGNIFRDLISLTRLYLNNNHIRVLPKDIFSSLTSLEMLYLDHNNIKELPQNIFENLTSLEILQLNDNKIYMLPKDIFTNLRYLEMLNLAKNNIKILPENIFRHLDNLFDLNLANNGIMPQDLSEVFNATLKDVIHVYYEEPTNT